MSEQPTPTPPTTQKADRKAAAADANDPQIFQRSAFGRLRVPSVPVRIMVGVTAVFVIPFVVLYRWIRGPKQPR